MSHTTGAVLATLLALAACDPPTVPQPGGSANYSAGLGDGPDFSRPHGRIAVQTWLEYGETSLGGAFAEGPPLELRTEAQRIGNCRLMTWEPSTCSPACTGGEVCVDGECEAYPARVHRGVLRWVWPDGDQLVEPDGLLAYYATGTATQAGEVSITVEETTLVAPTIEGADPIGDWAQDIERRDSGADVTLAWRNPIDEARVRLSMTDCAGSHGGIGAAEIECEGPDSGELTLPGAFIDAIEGGDWSHGECGSHPFQRYHAAAPDGDDTVRLETIGDAGFFWRPDW